MAIRPLADRVVVKVIEDTDQTSGGIFIPDSAKEKPQKGEVIAVGTGKKNDKGEREELDVKVGEIVLYEKYAGSEMKIDGQVVKILNEKDILGVIE
ncbi:co-chaperone GroES [bacterium]|nr:co-chaperone GroES [bacterium]